jgi:hypothetical protein
VTGKLRQQGKARSHSDSEPRNEIVGEVLAVAATGGMTIDSARSVG